jgi:hypothetical protein
MSGINGGSIADESRRYAPAECSHRSGLGPIQLSFLGGVHAACVRTWHIGTWTFPLAITTDSMGDLQPVIGKASAAGATGRRCYLIIGLAQGPRDAWDSGDSVTQSVRAREPGSCSSPSIYWEGHCAHAASKHRARPCRKRERNVSCETDHSSQLGPSELVALRARRENPRPATDDAM